MKKQRRTAEAAYDFSSLPTMSTTSENSSSEANLEVEPIKLLRSPETYHHFIVNALEDDLEDGCFMKDKDGNALTEPMQATLFCGNRDEAFVDGNFVFEDWIRLRPDDFCCVRPQLVLMHRSTYLELGKLRERFGHFEMAWETKEHKKDRTLVAIHALRMFTRETLLEETLKSSPNKCANKSCGNKALLLCICKSVFFCSSACQAGAKLNGDHSSSHCTSIFAGRLLKDGLTQRAVLQKRANDERAECRGEEE